MEENKPTVSFGELGSDQLQGSSASCHSVPAALDENEQRDEVTIRSNVPHSKWDPRQFKTLVTLGKGNYATVYLVESSQTKQLYAMKVRSKKLLQMNSEIESIGTEKTILQLAKKEKHPFVVDVFGGFQTQSHIMLYLEFCQGGDLMHHVQCGEQFNLERSR
jgi:serine/threonine protein kinase